MEEKYNKVITIEKGSVLYHRGEECHTAFVLKSGKLGFYLNYGKENQFALLTISEPGASLGEMGLIDSSTRNGTLVAEEDSVVLEIDKEKFPEFLSNNPDLAYKMILSLANRFKIAAKELKSTQNLVKELVETLNEEKLNSKPSLMEKIKSFAASIIDVPNDIPPELYSILYDRNQIERF